MKNPTVTTRIATIAALLACSGMAQVNTTEQAESTGENVDIAPPQPGRPAAADTGPVAAPEKFRYPHVPPESGSGKWRITIGLSLRRIAAMRYSGGCYSSAHPIPAMSGSGTRGGNSMGGASEYGDREYTDGYVHTDGYTTLDGGTSVWGYENQGQVNGGNISFHGVSRTENEFSRTRTISSLEWAKTSDREYGWMLSAERTVFETGPLAAALSLGFSRANFSASGAGTTFRDSQRWRVFRVDVTDTYSLEGTGISENSQPGQWTPDNPGPAIDNMPASRRESRRLVSSGTYEAYNSISESLDMSLSTFSLGVALGTGWRRIRVNGIVGPTLNLVETDAVYKETLYESRNGAPPGVSQHWEETDSGSDYVLGMFAEAGITLELTAHLQAGVFGRYDWLKNIDGRTGPARYSINPEGGSLGATLGFAF